MSTAVADRYFARFRRVLDYIDAHLEDGLTVEELSGVAAFSKYHFHRQFSALFGIGVYKYVQLRRLKRASYRLAFREHLQIVEIALASGYEGPEAFARAFKKATGQTPSEFREQPHWDSWHATYRPLSELRIEHMRSEHGVEQVRIVHVKDINVAVLEHRGSAAELEASTRKFIEWRRRSKLPPQASATFNVVYKHTDEDCRYDLCAATERDVPDPALGIVMKVLPGGRCAVLRHVGSDDTLGSTVSYLYATWLPQSGEELRDFPLYFQRVRFFPDVPEQEVVTDVFLPLA